MNSGFLKSSEGFRKPKRPCSRRSSHDQSRQLRGRNPGKTGRQDRLAPLDRDIEIRRSEHEFRANLPIGTRSRSTTEDRQNVPKKNAERIHPMTTANATRLSLTVRPLRDAFALV